MAKFYPAGSNRIHISPYGAGVSPEQSSALAGLVEKQRQRQRAELAEAIERALEHVPRLLRGTLRRMLFP
jgi:hypothetical protein